MAKQAGILPIRGTIDNVNFTKREDSFFVGKKTGVDKERILTDPNFKLTRETMAEFAASSKAWKFLLRAFREIVTHKPDSRISGRLQKRMMEVTKSDQSHIRGLRKPWDGDQTLLKGFEFNRKSELFQVFWGDFNPTIDRVTGAVSVQVPAFIPDDLLTMPEKGTHYRFVLGGIELDLQGETYVRQSAHSAWLPGITNDTPTAPVTLSVTLTPNSTLPLYSVFGLEFAVEDNGQKYPMKGGAFNAAAIVQIDA